MSKVPFPRHIRAANAFLLSPAMPMSTVEIQNARGPVIGSSTVRKPYTGTTRSLVIGLDVGFSFSGVSYAILEPGEVPKIYGVTRFPGQEHLAGSSKVPTILFYNQHGQLMAAGAEAESSTIQAEAEDENWSKVELFKLKLRPRSMKLDTRGLRLPPLPRNKNAETIFGDFLHYLYWCTRSFIIDTHANGASLWTSVEENIHLVLTHPNGWEGPQQSAMRRSAVHGGLIPDTDEGRARIRFVTEGEASLHACILNGLVDDVLAAPSQNGFLIVDAGGGTLDVSSYRIVATDPIDIEELAPPDCIFAGSVFVSRRAREFLREKLKNSKYGMTDSLDHITKRFDETTKRLFRDKKETQFIHFGSPLDKDLTVGIRSGQLKLTGAEVAEFFEPSVKAAVNAIKNQIDASSGMIKSVFLVGGYAASSWLFTQLQERLKDFAITVNRPDTQTSKAVADGAIGYFLDHHVSTRVSKFIYGLEYLREFDESDPEHLERKHRLCELPSGPRLLLDAFDCILGKGVKVKETTVFSRKYCTELTNLNSLAVFEVDIWCYRGGRVIPEWIERGAEHFSTLCRVRADLSPLSATAEPKKGVNGKIYWNIVFSVEIHFGLTEFQARIKWVDNGTTKYGPASIVYNERGYRSDDEDTKEDEAYPASDIDSPSGLSRWQSQVTSAASSKRNSDWSLPAVEVSSETGSSQTSSRTVSRIGTPREDRRRGRSSRQKELDLERTSNLAVSTSTRSSSLLAEALSSVWGTITSPTIELPPAKDPTSPPSSQQGLAKDPSFGRDVALRTVETDSLKEATLPGSSRAEPQLNAEEPPQIEQPPAASTLSQDDQLPPASTLSQDEDEAGVPLDDRHRTEVAETEVEVSVEVDAPLVPQATTGEDDQDTTTPSAPAPAGSEVAPSFEAALNTVQVETLKAEVATEPSAHPTEEVDSSQASNPMETNLNSPSHTEGEPQARLVEETSSSISSSPIASGPTDNPEVSEHESITDSHSSGETVTGTGLRQSSANSDETVTTTENKDDSSTSSQNTPHTVEESLTESCPPPTDHPSTPTLASCDSTTAETLESPTTVAEGESIPPTADADGPPVGETSDSSSPSIAQTAITTGDSTKLIGSPATLVVPDEGTSQALELAPAPQEGVESSRTPEPEASGSGNMTPAAAKPDEDEQAQQDEEEETQAEKEPSRKLSKSQKKKEKKRRASQAISLSKSLSMDATSKKITEDNKENEQITGT